MEIEPVPIIFKDDPEQNKKFKKTVTIQLLTLQKKANPNNDKKKEMFNYYGDFDLAPYLEGPNHGSS